MPNLAAVFKAEISRLARKEVRSELAAVKKTVARNRREIADLKRQLKDQAKKISVLERGSAKTKPDQPSADGASVRFASTWVRNHREKLNLSQADYAALVGVSTLTIYNWETGKTRPAARQLAAWGAVRALGKREAWKRLDEMD